MKAVFSIKPKFAEAILSGEKRFEFRRVIFRAADVRVILIYATAPVGMVVGQFEVRSIISDHPKKVWQVTKAHAGITRENFYRYFSGQSVAHAIAVANVRVYRRPLMLCDLRPGLRAPQSFAYI